MGKEMNEVVDTWSKDGAICPYCGYINLPEDDNWRLYDESTDEWECGECCKTFNVSIYVSHSWTCEPKEDKK